MMYGELYDTNSSPGVIQITYITTCDKKNACRC